MERTVKGQCCWWRLRAGGCCSLTLIALIAATFSGLCEPGTIAVAPPALFCGRAA